MNKRTFALTCVALLLVVAALAKRLIPRHTDAEYRNQYAMMTKADPLIFKGIVDPIGYIWHFTSNFQGNITIYNGQGHPIGIFLLPTGDPTQGDVLVSVHGNSKLRDRTMPLWVRKSGDIVKGIPVSGQWKIRGPGRHEIRDTHGNLVGVVVLSPLTAQDVSQIKHGDRMPRDLDAAAKWERRNMLSGNNWDSSPIHVALIDKESGLFWMMRGIGTVEVNEFEYRPRYTGAMGGTINNLAGSLSAVHDRNDGISLTPLERRSLPQELQFADAELQTPQFVFMVDDKVIHERGYGTHTIRDTRGRPLLVLKATPPPPVPPGK